MTDREINEAIARGVSRRKEERWNKMKEITSMFQLKIKRADTPKKVRVLANEIEDLRFEHYRMAEKSREYRNYEDAESNDEYEEIYSELADELDEVDVKCNNCNGMILELDEECPDCGRKA